MYIFSPTGFGVKFKMVWWGGDTMVRWGGDTMEGGLKKAKVEQKKVTVTLPDTSYVICRSLGVLSCLSDKCLFGCFSTKKNCFKLNKRNKQVTIL